MLMYLTKKRLLRNSSSICSCCCVHGEEGGLSSIVVVEGSGGGNGGEEAAGAMIARNYVEYISLTAVHNKLHFIIIHIDERAENNQDKCQRAF
jgi:hypothetical protein